MGEKKVLVVIPMKEEQKRGLEALMPDAVFVYEQAETVAEETVKEAEIILGNVPPEKIGASPKLQWIHLNSAGADPYIRPGVLGEETILTTSSGAYGKAVSEHLFAMLLGMQKKLHLYRDNQMEGIWKDEGEVTSVTDMTVVIFGAGDIGRHFAGLVHGMGAYVIGVKRTPGPCMEELDELHTIEQKEELLARADAVVSFLPSTEETRGIFDRKAFAQMKPGSYFLNGGRGDAVCTEDLCDALESGHLGGAALDVTDPEPLPSGHRLWRLRNAWITPHISGFYHLPETLKNVVAITTENVRNYAAGEKLKNIVEH